MGYGIFQMQQKPWTDAAGLSMEGLHLAGDMAKSRDKKVVQTTTTKKSGGSGGLLGGLGSVAGGLVGSFFGPAGTMMGSMLGGGLGGALEGGSAGAAAGLATGLGVGSSEAMGDFYGGVRSWFSNPAESADLGGIGGVKKPGLVHPDRRF